MTTRTVVLAVAFSVTAACDKHEFHPPERAAQVSAADSMLAAAVFDTITFASDSARTFEGNNVYAAHCRDCHGFRGEGSTDYGREHDIYPPSLVREDWPFADVAAVRARIFTGHTSMPTWGVAGITPREIDAVAFYVAEVLRRELPQ